MKLTPDEIQDIARLIRWRIRKAEEAKFLQAAPARKAARATEMAFWRYKGVLTYVQHIPIEDRRTLFEHKLHGTGPHRLEEPSGGDAP